MIGSLINKYSNASNRINHLNLFYEEFEDTKQGRKRQTTIYKSYTSDTIFVSVHLHVCAIMGSINS